MAMMERVLRAIYPPHCLKCSQVVEDTQGLCPTCWRDTPFILGLVCDLCGIPLPGEDPGTALHCDTCQKHARPWRQGRAALLYQDAGRDLALSFKHADRTDLAAPAAGWMLRAAEPLLEEGMLLAPIPLHRWRLLKRRFNQAALLSQGIARLGQLAHCPDLLLRQRATPSQKGHGIEGRYANVAEAFTVNPVHQRSLQDRIVLLIDDVMTSGATFAAAAEACLTGGAREVRVLALARAAPDP